MMTETTTPNRMFIEPTEFVNPTTKEVSYGYRIFDNYARTYSDFWKEIPTDHMGILNMVLHDAKYGSNEDIRDMFALLDLNKEGIFINQNFYSWQSIQALVQELFK